MPLLHARLSMFAQQAYADLDALAKGIERLRAAPLLAVQLAQAGQVARQRQATARPGSSSKAWRASLMAPSKAISRLDCQGK